MSFKERFKGKISSINRQGNIASDNGSAIPIRCTKPPIPLAKSKPSVPGNAQVLLRPTYKVSSETEEPRPKALSANNTNNLFYANPYPNVEDIMRNPLPEMETKENSCNQNRVEKPGLPGKYEKLTRKSSNEVLDRKNIRDTAYQQINPLHYPKEIVQKSGQRSYSIPRAETKPSVCESTKGLTTKYYELGGLGANIGSEDWAVKKEKQARMTEYAKAITKVNKARPMNSVDKPPLPKKVVPANVEEAKRKKAKMLEYSKRVPKPKQTRVADTEEIDNVEELVKEEPVRELTELEKLEQQHNEYMEQIEKLKQQFT